MPHVIVAFKPPGTLSRALDTHTLACVHFTLLLLILTAAEQSGVGFRVGRNNTKAVPNHTAIDVSIQLLMSTTAAVLLHAVYTCYMLYRYLCS